MRQTASYQAAKLGKFENGSTGAVLVQNLGEWMQIDDNGTIGYVPSRFVQDEPTVAYTGTATASDVAGVWNVFGAYNIINVYENGYWMAFGNYFPVAYGYYIMQNNEIKLIAIEEIAPNHFEGGNLKYETVRKVYGIIDISSLNDQTRIEFLTGNEAEEDLEGIDPYYCTKAQFMGEAKTAAKRVKDIINTTDIQLQELVEQSEEPAEEPVADEVTEPVADEVVEPAVVPFDDVYVELDEEPSFLENVKDDILYFFHSGQVFGVIRIILIITMGLLALGLLFFLVVSLIKYLPSIVAWTKESCDNTVSSIKSMTANAKEQLGNVKPTTAAESSHLHEQTKDITTTGNINFCSSCGHKVDGSPKFCPECGKALVEGVSSGFSFSRLGGNVSDIMSKTASKVSETTSNIKKNLNDKEEASRKTVNITSLKYKDDSPERVVGAFYVKLGAELVKKPVCVHFTTKALLIYASRDKSILQRLFSKDEEAVLDCKIDLKDIKQISRVQYPLSKLFSYEIVTANKTYSMCTEVEPYTFSLYLSMVLNFDSSIFNIDLLPEERVKFVTAVTVDSGDGKNYGTLYISNKRVVFARIANSTLARKSDRLTTEEGTEVLFSIDLEHFKTIVSENRGLTNCEYLVKDDNGHYVIHFSKVVPKPFLALVPNAIGNKDLLERKKKVMKGLKIVLLVVSFLGLAGDADADEADVDTEEFDMDGDGEIDTIGYDTDGDGVMDTFASDTDGDGVMDTFACDTDGDGVMDSFASDSNGDGVIDDIAYDSNGDGMIDTVEMDTNGDGIMDAKAMDADGDGTFDTLGKDSNGDGVIDTFGADMDGDGNLDTFSMDTNNDGVMDTLAADTNGDGMIDKVAFDTNGDGAYDAIKMDTNNDGILDTTGVDVNYDGRMDTAYRG